MTCPRFRLPSPSLSTRGPPPAYPAPLPLKLCILACCWKLVYAREVPKVIECFSGYLLMMLIDFLVDGSIYIGYPGIRLWESGAVSPGNFLLPQRYDTTYVFGAFR
ncbi:hypothetical protein MUK42_10476 [Musa troglodytarum]|uniref:Uncharacterized protein n=1 Tax=Musa troglodytarum TaxID=320322 RepID=A0A9E7GYM5_9LILI|nr:hypothetical protein MUK42_10476 [Musa troglodytarum]